MTAQPGEAPRYESYTAAFSSYSDLCEHSVSERGRRPSPLTKAATRAARVDEEEESSSSPSSSAAAAELEAESRCAESSFWRLGDGEGPPSGLLWSGGTPAPDIDA